MELILFLIIIFVAIFIGYLVFSGKKRKKPSETVENRDEHLYSYRSCMSLVTPAERSFFAILEQAADDNFRIFTKVRMADIIKVSNLSGKKWRTAFNKISSKHLDFVLCTPQTFTIAGVVELDDRTHDMQDRKERDEFVDEALKSAGIPLIRYPVQRDYRTDEVRQKLDPVFVYRENLKICPRCSSPLIKKKAGKGRHAGKEFWGCSGFPDCRYIEDDDPKNTSPN